MKRAILVLLLIAAVAGCTAHAENKDKIYTINTSPGEVATDASAEYMLTITPKSPWKLKATTPLKVTLKGSEGVELERTKLSNKDLQDANEKAKALKTTFKCTKDGAHTIAADLSFFLCTDEICQRYTDETTLTVTAKK